jgi:hypothetical protein
MAELRLLCFLCDPQLDRSAQREVMELLRGHCFSSTAHQVLFDSLSALLATRAVLPAELLPAQLVKAGFPDFDLNCYLRPSGLDVAEALALSTRLRE